MLEPGGWNIKQASEEFGAVMCARLNAIYEINRKLTAVMSEILAENTSVISGSRLQELYDSGGLERIFGDTETIYSLYYERISAIKRGSFDIYYSLRGAWSNVFEPLAEPLRLKLVLLDTSMYPAIKGVDSSPKIISASVEGIGQCSAVELERIYGRVDDYLKWLRNID